MMATFWRYIAASVVGTSHSRTGQPCQDAHACRLFESMTATPVLALAVADGAGSARHADQGAILACEMFATAIQSHLDSGGAIKGLTKAWVEHWIYELQAAVDDRATATDAEARDFACTLLGAVVGLDEAVFFQIGDGAIVVALREAPDAYHLTFWPEQGEYANITVFVTQPGSVTHLQYAYCSSRVEEVALLSDGLQRLALDYTSERAHGPFFEPMFRPLRSAAPGFSNRLADALISFLASDNVNRRTDDDKTLVLATRRPAELAEGSAVTQPPAVEVQDERADRR